MDVHQMVLSNSTPRLYNKIIHACVTKIILAWCCKIMVFFLATIVLVRNYTSNSWQLYLLRLCRTYLNDPRKLSCLVDVSNLVYPASFTSHIFHIPEVGGKKHRFGIYDPPGCLRVFHPRGGVRLGTHGPHFHGVKAENRDADPPALAADWNPGWAKPDGEVNMVNVDRPTQQLQLD